MKTNRRKFLQTTGAGTLGWGLASALPSVAAYGEGRAKVGGTRKMIVRADDVGHSRVCNSGAFEAIEKGVVTSADVLLDSPGTEDALERLKALPWISVGWHMHMWGTPVLDPKQVPSLVAKERQLAGRFRLDLTQASDVVYDEALKELRAQLDRCIRLLGRVPDTGDVGRGDSPWSRAARQVHDEYAIAYNFASSARTSDMYINKIEAARKAGEEWAQYYSTTRSPGMKADEKWASRKIFTPAGTTAYVDLLPDSLAEAEKEFDAVQFYLEDHAEILKYPADVTFVQCWHPGSIDYYVCRLCERGDRTCAQQFVVGRQQDVAALCDHRLRNWIKENKIELVNFRDALYGTREYQNRLRLAGSDLYMV